MGVGRGEVLVYICAPLEEDEELALMLALEALKRQTADMEP